ncbi:MAG: hypothetical protein Q7T25_03975, partial [Sideroxyarcus sp.]|nr:hypothetical protein [Sideroxyarcus sp.]
MVALLCCHYANQESVETERIQERYLRAEQVAAYLKLSVGGLTPGFLGVTQAGKNFARDRIVLGGTVEAQLLASQASYGLWGLYSSALEAAQLISDANRRLSPSGDVLVRKIISQFGSAGWDEFCILAGGKLLDKARTAKLAPQFIAALGSPSLRTTVVQALLASQHDCVLQAELFPLAQAYLVQQRLQPREWRIDDFCAWISKNSNASGDLKTAMARICSLDPLLKLADILMLWMQGKNGESISALAQMLQPHVQKVALSEEWEHEAELPHRAFLIALRAAARDGDASAMICAVLAQNKSLMQARGGAAWIEVDGMGKLVVRVRNDKPQDLDNLGK